LAGAGRVGESRSRRASSKRSSCFSTCALRAGEGGCCLGLPPHGAPPSIPRRQPRWVSSTRRIPSRSAFRESLRYGYPAPRAAPQHTHPTGLTTRGLQAVTSPGELLRERNSLRRAFGPGALLPVRKEKVPPKAWGGRKRFGRREKEAGGAAFNALAVLLAARLKAHPQPASFTALRVML